MDKNLNYSLKNKETKFVIVKMVGLQKKIESLFTSDLLPVIK